MMQLGMLYLAAVWILWDRSPLSLYADLCRRNAKGDPARCCTYIMHGLALQVSILSIVLPLHAISV